MVVLGGGLLFISEVPLPCRTRLVVGGVMRAIDEGLPPCRIQCTPERKVNRTCFMNILEEDDSCQNALINFILDPQKCVFDPHKLKINLTVQIIASPPPTNFQHDHAEALETWP